MMKQAYGYAAVTLLLGISPVSHAELEPISDDVMGEVTGQAFMQIDNMAGNGVDYTRMTLGMEINTRLNIDDVRVGEINEGADFSAQHLALGHLARTDGEIFNGNTYNEGDLIPFEVRRPYIELANVPGSDEIVGFRMGFSEARGSVSSHTESFSGNITGLKIRDDGMPDMPVFDAALFGGSGLAETSHRATHVGMKLEGATGCFENFTCAPLTNLRSVIVGEDTGAGDGTIGFTDGFFIGFQREGMDWQTLDGANTIHAGKGVFINLPVNMTIDRTVLVNGGVDRLRTHQVDRHNNLF